MIRDVRPADAHDVWAIITQSLGYTSGEAVVRRRISYLAEDQRCISLVHEDADGRVTGFIHALRYDTLHNEGGWDVISLAVLPAYQGEGVGKRLLGALEERVAACGGSFVRLNSRVERVDAHGFYEHVGYECDKLQKHFVKHL